MPNASLSAYNELPYLVYFRHCTSLCLGMRNWNTTGVLELGGASTQIAFVPQGNILANKFPVHLAGVTYNLYVHSYLIYGQDMVDRWIKERVFQDSNPPRHNRTVANPCMLKGKLHTHTL